MITDRQVAVVTAGGNGIGRAICVALAGRGMKVVVADVDTSAAEETAAAVRSSGGLAMGIYCDVTDEKTLENVRAEALAEFGSVDLLVSHAGGSIHGQVEEVSISDWQWLLDLNVLSMARALRVFLPDMIAAGSGHVVFTTSSLALIPGHPHAGAVIPYIASKGAVTSLAQSAYMYLAPRGVGVTLFAPDYTDTGFPLAARRVGLSSATPGSQIPYPPQTPEQAAGVLIAALDSGDFLASATPGFDELLRVAAAAGLDPSAVTPMYADFASR